MPAGIEGRIDDCENNQNNQWSPQRPYGSRLRNARSSEVSEPTCTKTPDEFNKKAYADHIFENNVLKHTA